MNKKELENHVRILKQEYLLDEEEIRYLYNYKHGELIMQKLVNNRKDTGNKCK